MTSATSAAAATHVAASPSLARWRRGVVAWQRMVPLAIVAVVFGVAAWSVQSYPVGIFHDDGVYLILAKALATGEGYRYLHIPGAPVATHYPPGYPVLLAVLWRLAPSFPQNVSLFLLANAALLAAAAHGVFTLGRRLGWRTSVAAVAAVIATLSLPMLTLANTVMSEVLFLALLLPVLAAAERLVDRSDVGGTRTVLHDVTIGLAAGALALVRTHALAAIGGLLIVLLCRRRWRTALCSASGAFVALIPWALWVTRYDNALPAPLSGSYGSYLAWYADGLAGGGLAFVGATVLANIGHVAALFADRVAPWSIGWLRLAGLACAIVLLSVGLGLAARRRRVPVTVAFFALYLALVLVWPFAPWRFFWGIWPLIVVFLIDGMRGVFARWAARSTRAPRVVAIRASVAVANALLATGLLTSEAQAYRAHAWTSPARNAVREIAPLMRWVRRHTAPGDVLLADAEPLVYLFTGRLVMPPVPFSAREYVTPVPIAQHTQPMAELLARYHVRYVITVVPSTRATVARLAATGLPGTLRVREMETLPNGGAFLVEGR